MPSDDLNEAIQLIQQGQPAQAQPILQALIKANPQDLGAWSWYVKSCPTPEQRLKALEMCLKFNPGNADVLDAIRKVQAKLSVTAPPPAFTSTPAAFGQSAASADMNAYAAVAAAIPSTASTIESAEPAREFTGLDETPGRPFLWYDVWRRALTQANVDSYTALLRDPLASPGRAYWWVFMSGLITGLVSLLNPSVMVALNQFEQLEGAANFGTLVAIALLVLVPVSAVFSVLGLVVGAAIYNLLAKLFGGSGNFSRTVYLLGAYTAPLSIVTGIVSIIPFVNCLAIILGFYSFWLSITSIQAAHRLIGGRAFMVLLIPTLIIFMLICITLAIGGQAMIEALEALPREPVY
jgi:hypothetical protein